MKRSKGQAGIANLTQTNAQLAEFFFGFSEDQDGLFLVHWLNENGCNNYSTICRKKGNTSKADFVNELMQI